MAVPSSSSCEVLDLGLAASCDDTTSQLFFSKGGGGDLSWPAAAGVGSALTNQKSLVALCDKYGVPREFKPVPADTLRCGVCETPPQGSNALCIYSDALEAGLRFPLHDFYLKLLRHYRLAPSQLAPNAWKYMAAFVLRCKDAGVQPLVSAFRYFFSLYAHKNGDKALEWHHFQPCASRPRLFYGTLPTRYDWKTRFFFLKSPEGMPWKCPVAWGKPRREDARAVELTDAAVDKLKQIPCIDLKDYLSLHAPPVGALTMLQLHSTPAPMAKPECAAASARALALTSHPQLHAALEAGARAASAADAAGEGDDSTPRKRRCPGPSPAAVTPQNSTISASFDGASGSSGISLPPGIWTGNSDYEYDMVRMQGEQRENQIKLRETKLQESEAKLRETEAMSDKFLDYLYNKRAENDLLKEKQARLIEEQAAVVARMKAERAAEVAKLQEEHASAVAQLTKHLNDEHAVSIARLNEEHAADLARVKDAAEKKVQDVMKNVVRILCPEADLSQLDGPKLKGDLAAAGTPEAEGRSATS
ncbi:unnamed protein product [Miscanthus lutarioriparius]|uniref:Transposase (putative) gypsy type domain-containing protein n=1 Tax=Miscanthus lutarioriparius TaxID=422564 RepID=A0A811QYA2_9POAL|nr:unnamed protein product [Miscanthus lutarioriparius]